MSKYTPLKDYLQAQITSEVPLSFAEIEALIGAALPASAYKHRPWWANEAAGHVHAQAWLEAGYEASQVDMPGRKLVFRRLQTVPGIARPGRGRPGGMSDPERAYQDAGGERAAGRHPAWGALAGTFWIDPDWAANPAATNSDLAEWDAGLDSKAKRIDEALKGSP